MTPTPEMDAFERDIIACIPEELHQLQAYARNGRELETRLAAAEAELAAMREALAHARTLLRNNGVLGPELDPINAALTGQAKKGEG